MRAVSAVLDRRHAGWAVDLEGDIRHAMESGGASVAGLGGKLDGTTQDAVELKGKMDALKGQYEAELIDNFKAKKIDADQLRRALEAIPAKVYSEVTIRERRIFEEEHRTSEHEGRARGGPVRRGKPYIVGETGPELYTSGGRLGVVGLGGPQLLVPSRSGMITPPINPAQMMRSIQSQFAPAPTSVPALQTPQPITVQAPMNNSRQYSMPVYTNQSPAALSQSLALIEALVN